MIKDRCKLLASFTSNDETRSHLSYAYVCPKLKGLVATDGHRAIVDTGLYDCKNDGKLVHASTLKAGRLAYESIDGVAYPNVDRIIGAAKGDGHSFDWSIPDSFKVLKKRCAAMIRPVSGDVVLNWDSLEPEIELLDTPDGEVESKVEPVGIDLALLAPLNGLTVLFETNGPLSAIKWSVAGGDIHGLIMPMRLS